jgi:hypothetical protein
MGIVMMITLNESATVMKARNAQAAYAAAIAAPFYAGSISQTAARAVSLFWSVFGPAARYNFGNPDYAYAALMKP